MVSYLQKFITEIKISGKNNMLAFMLALTLIMFIIAVIGYVQNQSSNTIISQSKARNSQPETLTTLMENIISNNLFKKPHEAATPITTIKRNYHIVGILFSQQTPSVVIQLDDETTQVAYIGTTLPDGFTIIQINPTKVWLRKNGQLASIAIDWDVQNSNIFTDLKGFTLPEILKRFGIQNKRIINFYE